MQVGMGGNNVGKSICEVDRVLIALSSNGPERICTILWNEINTLPECY